MGQTESTGEWTDNQQVMTTTVVGAQYGRQLMTIMMMISEAVRYLICVLECSCI